MDENLKQYVKLSGKGLTENGIKMMTDLMGMIDFDDIVGTSDLRLESELSKYATESDYKKVYKKLTKIYGIKRVREVLNDTYGGVDLWY
jgi:CTP:phosphocholine cytidylyltransferase-like protein